MPLVTDHIPLVNIWMKSGDCSQDRIVHRWSSFMFHRSKSRKLQQEIAMSALVVSWFCKKKLSDMWSSRFSLSMSIEMWLYRAASKKLHRFSFVKRKLGQKKK